MRVFLSLQQPTFSSRSTCEACVEGSSRCSTQTCLDGEERLRTQGRVGRRAPPSERESKNEALGSRRRGWRDTSAGCVSALVGESLELTVAQRVTRVVHHDALVGPQIPMDPRRPRLVDSRHPLGLSPDLSLSLRLSPRFSLSFSLFLSLCVRAPGPTRLNLHPCRGPPSLPNPRLSNALGD